MQQCVEIVIIDLNVLEKMHCREAPNEFVKCVHIEDTQIVILIGNNQSIVDCLCMYRYWIDCMVLFNLYGAQSQSKSTILGNNPKRDEFCL